MDPYGHIYRDIAENVPAEDKARLDGYLIARAEADKAKRKKAAKKKRKKHRRHH